MVWSTFLLTIMADITVAQHSTAQMHVGDWAWLGFYKLDRSEVADVCINDTRNSPAVDLRTPPPERMFHGLLPTDRKFDMLEGRLVPTREFTIEMWVLDHVNQPVGALVFADDRSRSTPPAYALGYFDGQLYFSLHRRDVHTPYVITSHIDTSRRFKARWAHLVGVYDGDEMHLYLNGVALDSLPVESPIAPTGDDLRLELAGYYSNEPFMTLANYVKTLRIYNTAMDASVIQQRFAHLAEMVEQGKLCDERFHFTAGPYLNYATETTINVVWETDRPSAARIHYGLTPQLEQMKTIVTPRRIQEITLDDLQVGKQYLYRVRARSDDGETLDSELLTFGTAVPSGEPFSFAIIGDTEARPHINNHIAKLVWGERPNFVVNVGDLTDGGTKENKFEWNLEYFVGMNQLHSRIPVYPVPGNGEGDLHWYSRFHALPEPEAYYSFTYGNAEFFMLDSNRGYTDFKPDGVQHEWLEKALSESMAKWLFVVHHHPPYSSYDDDYSDMDDNSHSTYGDVNSRRLQQLYDRFGVDMVFCGHMHQYERTWPIFEGRVHPYKGVRYITTGGAGGDLENFGPTRMWFSAKTYRGHNFVMINILGDTLVGQMYDLHGYMRDQFIVRKDSAGVPDRQALLN